MTIFAKIVASLSLAISSLFVPIQHNSQDQIAGSFTPVEGTVFYVSKTIEPADTTITLSSFGTPNGLHQYTMADFGSIGYATLDPTNSQKLETISFTGITQNATNAVLTGVTRGIDFVPPYAASSTLAYIHLVGSTMILSNPAAFYGQQFALINTPEVITADWQGPNPINPQSYATKLYVDGAAFGGIGGASETATGTVQIATGAQVAASTENGSIGRLVIPSSLSTSTWSASVPVGTVPAIGTVGGKIDPNFIPSPSSISVSTTSATIGAFPAWEIGKQYWVDTTIGTSTFLVPAGVPVVHVRLVGAGGSNSSINSPGQWSTFGTNGYFCYGNGGNQGGTNNGIGGNAYGGNINSQGGDGQIGTSNTIGGGSYFGGGKNVSANGTTFGAGQGGASSAAGGAGGYCEGWFGVAPPATTTATTSIQVFVGANINGGGDSGAVIIDW